MASIARMLVDSPDFTPLPYGLFSVVQMPGERDLHWANGVIHQPDAPCGPASSTLNPCPSPNTITKAPSATGIPMMGADPFTVYGFVDCGPIGFAPDEYTDRAEAALLRGSERAVERVFWTGSVTATGAPLVQPHLAANAEVVGGQGEISQLAASPVTSGTAVDVVEALGAVEGALALCYGGVGVIHVPRAMIAHLKAQGLVYHDETTDQLVTCGGNLVAAGSGYPGTSPAGANPTAGEAWMYGTGAVTLRRGPVNTTPFVESVDKINNQLVLLAEQTYVLTWDCCLIAAQVSLGGIIAGGIGVRT